MSLLTEHDIVNMRFKAPNDVDQGYDQDEVDIFLDQVADTIAKLTKEKTELENKLKVAQSRIAELEGGAGTVAAPQASAGASDPTEATSVLAMAQKLHDEHIDNAKAESARLIAEAENKSKSIVGEAEQKYNSTLAKLEEDKSTLERKIAELRDFERDYRTRLKSYLGSLLSSVDSGEVKSN